MDKNKLDLIQNIVEVCDELDKYDMLKEADILEGIMIKVAGEEGMVKVAFFHKERFKEWTESLKSLLPQALNINDLPDKNSRQSLIKNIGTYLKAVISEGQRLVLDMKRQSNNPSIQDNLPVAEKNIQLLQKYQGDVIPSDYTTVAHKAQGILTTVEQLETIADATPVVE